MASIQHLVSPLTGQVFYRAQVRIKGRPQQSARFPNRKEAHAWTASLESAIRESRHFPHAAARRTSFEALFEDYVNTVLKEPGRFDDKERGIRERQLRWWARHFAGLSLADATADRISAARDLLTQETFTRGKVDKKASRKLERPKRYVRSGATINRYIAALSHPLSLAVKGRRLLDRNPVSDIRGIPRVRGFGGARQYDADCSGVA